MVLFTINLQAIEETKDANVRVANWFCLWREK